MLKNVRAMLNYVHGKVDNHSNYESTSIDTPVISAVFLSIRYFPEKNH